MVNSPAPKLPVRPAGSIVYDDACPICRRFARRYGSRLRAAGYQLIGLSEWGHCGCELDQMLLVRPDGRMLGGADALVELADVLPIARPMRWLRYLPGGRWLGAMGYRLLARWRYALGRLVEPAHPGHHDEQPGR